jgi:hypothetical protein
MLITEGFTRFLSRSKEGTIAALTWRLTASLVMAKIRTEYSSRDECGRWKSVKGEEIRGVRGVADKGVCTVHTVNIIPQLQYFLAGCLGVCVCDVFCLRSACV